ncbi:MAG: type I restriction-modification system endonuclease, partial [Anaerolineae bacterium]|nr:type I restriction-modification system endonuclease [Anaerolineae bacterium]
MNIRLFSTNFSHLKAHDEQLVRLGMLAERYYEDDPNTSLLKMRQFGELLTQHVASQMGLYRAEGESQYKLLYRLHDEGILPREIYQLFGEIRRAGNAASHDVQGDQQTALNVLRIGWQVGVWFHRTFKNADFNAGEFILPTDVGFERARLAAETEQAQAEVEQKLLDEQATSEKKQSRTFKKHRMAAHTANQYLHLDEPTTRQLIDEQLRQAGWEADSVNLRHGKGARPERGRNLAIAEWPTASGPADYILFIGTMPIAVVEAKRKNIDVSAALGQAKRYSRGFALGSDMQAPGNAWGEYQIPFAFSANGRPYLRQLETQSGIWFIDLRIPTNLGHALDGWYTPAGLKELLKRDEAEAQKQLDVEPFDYGFNLRYYQKEAIQAVEAGIA